MGLLDEWAKVKRDENDPYANQKWALGNNKPSPVPASPSAEMLPYKKSPFNWQAGNLALQNPQQKDSRYVDDARDRAMAGRQGMGANVVTPEDHQSSLFDDLLGRGTAKWGGVDKSQIDYSPLDKILASRMGLIDQLTGQTNQNFDKSDLALEQMHRALQNDLNTTAAGNYNKIADEGKANLQGVQDTSNQRIQNIKAEDMAKRQAMLKNLGIEAAGAQADTASDPLSEAQANIAEHANAGLVRMDQDRAGNLAFNQGISSSVGQQGVERRAALQQQLQQVLGKLGMAKTDYQNQDAQQRMQLDRDAEQRQYQEFDRERSYAADTANKMEDRAFQQQQAMAKSNQQKTSGFAGLAADLQHTGYDDATIQNAMGALTDVLGTQYMKGINPQEYDKTAVLTRRLQEPPYNLPKMIAGQLATNYGNLGSSNSY